MNELSETLAAAVRAVGAVWSAGGAAAVLRAVLIFVLGLVLASMVARRVRWPGATPRALFWVRQTVRYGLLFLAIFLALRTLGVGLDVLLGAAGILTVAVGFASQTAASNLISSWFLLGEQPFGVGDLIRVGDVFGEVTSIDALSVKVRTFDNVLIRIPNETLLKTNVVNTTRFPVRRVDTLLTVAFESDLDRVRQALLAVADRNPHCLEEPRPVVWFQGFAESGVSIKFSAWTLTDLYYDVGSNLVVEIKKALDAEGIEIPVPHVALYAGRASAPIAVRVADGDQPQKN